MPPGSKASRAAQGSGPAGQRGTVLAISLLLLLIVTVLGVNAMVLSNLEVVLAGNTQARVTALSEAENSLVDGENFIVTNFPTAPTFDWSTQTDDGLYMPGDLGASVVDAVDWLADDGAYEDAPSGGSYTIEFLGTYLAPGSSLSLGAGGGGDHRYLYRITGRGDAGKGGVRLAESIFMTSD